MLLRSPFPIPARAESRIPTSAFFPHGHKFLKGPLPNSKNRSGMMGGEEWGDIGTVWKSYLHSGMHLFPALPRTTFLGILLHFFDAFAIAGWTLPGLTAEEMGQGHWVVETTFRRHCRHAALRVAQQLADFLKAQLA